MLQLARAIVGETSGVLSRHQAPAAWSARLGLASCCFLDSSIGAMPWSSYNRRPLFAGTDWAGGSAGAGSAGRAPPIPPELCSLISRMAAENPLWGQERIANELL